MKEAITIKGIPTLKKWTTISLILPEGKTEFDEFSHEIAGASSAHIVDICSHADKISIVVEESYDPRFKMRIVLKGQLLQDGQSTHKMGEYGGHVHHHGKIYHLMMMSPDYATMEGEMIHHSFVNEGMSSEVHIQNAEAMAEAI